MKMMYNRDIFEPKPTIVFFSSYPPRECGIATFTQDLLKASQKHLGKLVNCRVAALNVSPLDTYNYPQEVEWKIDQNSKLDHQNLAKIVNDTSYITGVIIQHEYGIFGGSEGEILLSFMKRCKKPMLVTLHTVLPSPSDKMKEVTSKIIHYATTIVVLTKNSKLIIESLYPESVGKVFVIPHGIHPVKFSLPLEFKMKLKLEDHIVLSTFGLLSRGKGIEYVLHALPKVIKKYPNVLYLILGKTHPVIRRKEGENYRTELAQLITKLGLKKNVRFYDQYFNLPDLFEFLRATDIYISTSTDPNQSVSGTLSYALGVGRAVISTDFAQSKEVVTKDTGRLIPIKNSQKLTESLLDLLSDEDKLINMHRNSYNITRQMVWKNVAGKYFDLLERMIIPPIKLDHLLEMTDKFGLIQFATLSSPNKDSGYTLDDNARALIVCSWLLKQNPTKQLSALISIYFKFIKHCQQKNGSFINYIGHKDKLPTRQNDKEDLEDSQTRALWALAEVIANSTVDKSLRREAESVFLLHFNSNMPLTHLRSKAFAIKSYALVLHAFPNKSSILLSYISTFANQLTAAFYKNSVNSWRWFESDLNYNNALLSEALLIAGDVLKNQTYTNLGLTSLTFLISKTFSKTYLPIGHSDWYKNKQKRSNYDQQPEDPASMILALICAYEQTGNVHYKKLANKCFSWFLGNNTQKKSLYDFVNGGCFDGLHPDRVNLNQGAESLVSYLMSSFMITCLNK